MKKRLKIELAVLVCIACIWAIKLVTVDIGSTRATTPKQITKKIPHAAKTHLDLGNTYYDMNDPVEAIKSYQTAIRLDPNCFDAYVNLGDTYFSLGRCREAIECFKEALRIDPEYSFGYAALGLAYVNSGRYEEAIEAYKQAIELKPDIAGLHAILADTYNKADRPEESVLACKHTLTLNPNHPQAHFHLAEAYLKMGIKDLVLEEYEILKNLDEGLAEELLGLIGEQPVNNRQEAVQKSYLEQGTIEYKANWGQPVVNGQWEAGQSGTTTPIIDAHAIINNQLEQLKDNFKRRAETLRASGLSPQAHNEILAEMQKEYDEAKAKLTETKSQLDLIKKGIDSGEIDPVLGQEAMARLVLPPEVVDALFLKRVQNK